MRERCMPGDTFRLLLQLAVPAKSQGKTPKRVRHWRFHRRKLYYSKATWEPTDAHSRLGVLGRTDLCKQLQGSANSASRYRCGDPHFGQNEALFGIGAPQALQFALAAGCACGCHATPAGEWDVAPCGERIAVEAAPSPFGLSIK